MKKKKEKNKERKIQKFLFKLKKKKERKKYITQLCFGEYYETIESYRDRTIKEKKRKKEINKENDRTCET